tara:strand:+ start:8174 stop:9379 length:1206 start_codon:yes stop_codon:yes gene_type:complete
MVSVGSSTLGVYNPIFYAQEALIHLEKALGMASRVHRGFDSERKSFGKGDTINIRRPDTFTVASAPATAAGVATETVAITLDQWKEVKFALTDKELAYSGTRLIDDHIRPAAYALADNIDTALVNLWADGGNAVAWGGSNPITDITNARKAMFDAAVPMDGNLHMMLSGEMERQCLSNSAFSQWQGAGDTGVSTQLRGALGTKFGFQCFANQNAGGAASGENTYYTHGSHADNALAVNNGSGYAKGATSIVVDSGTGSQTILENAPLKIRMDNGMDHYTTAASSLTLSSGAGTLVIADGLRHAVSDDAVITLLGTGASKNTETGLAFHKNAFALAMAPLPELGNELGAKVATVSDPVTGLSLRSRVYYVGNSSQVHVALDVLYGVKTLDPAMAVRMERDLA